MKKLLEELPLPVVHKVLSLYHASDQKFMHLHVWSSTVTTSY